MIAENFGVNCAAATPVGADGAPRLDLFAAHCKALLNEGCHGVALLGTTGEANNFAVSERKALLEAALKAGVRGDQLLPGTSSCNVPETIELTRHAVDHGARACVLLPPFYYKGVSDEGLFHFYASVIEVVADDRLRVILYHIPQVTQVPISHELIARLRDAFPGIVAGIKDSAGDIANMTAMIERFPGFAVLAGADPLLLPLLQAGGAGCITATSNLRSDALRVIWDNWSDPEAADKVTAAQDRINGWRTLTNAYVQLPTVKAMLAKARGDADWRNLRAPLVKLTDEETNAVWAEMDRLNA
ncbi:dihydrodipicolinate synthase family protein [Primorskyibacter flagellatus]|uniref:4-hydroxy-tetrahydrodipicolinate synthase n=1 Tax=Primorskyibacter flagellatus TaxID=1387277 RepID=A0A1W2BYE2_9RHOB|nr:dihydrodipicolinate synthase family protein [Primorskyibacter flagellatus]SMC77774.1 4-hydroxy-tetrahydrodipicolinate synthase [Primorskyibacter flagellatus]